MHAYHETISYLVAEIPFIVHACKSKCQLSVIDFIMCAHRHYSYILNISWLPGDRYIGIDR